MLLPVSHLTINIFPCAVLFVYLWGSFGLFYPNQNYRCETSTGPQPRPMFPTLVWPRGGPLFKSEWNRPRPFVSQLICGQFTPDPPFIQSRAHSEHSRILLHSSFLYSTLGSGLRYAPIIACRELDHIKSLGDFVVLAEVQRRILGPI